jgi:hypothetical protein
MKERTIHQNDDHDSKVVMHIHASHHESFWIVYNVPRFENRTSGHLSRAPLNLSAIVVLLKLACVITINH